MDAPQQNFWRKCSTCKKPIALGGKYYVCSVSTCNGQRTGYVFCGIQCFESHLPGARHRDAGAIEKVAPRVAELGSAPSENGSSSSSTSPQRIIVRSQTGSPTPSGKMLPREILVIASRLKEYIQAKAEFNTSADVMDVLSDQLRVLCDRAIDNARAEGRKTVLNRDFDFLKK